MRTFKKIDLGIQLLLLLVAIAIGVLNFWSGMIFYFTCFLFWDGLSVFINLALFPVRNKTLRNRRRGMLVHTLVIIFFPIILLFLIQKWPDAIYIGRAYLLYAALLPIYYIWMNCREIKAMDELHDQVNLLDLGQH